jgi:predicted DNA-binding WGR domain protein
MRTFMSWRMPQYHAYLEKLDPAKRQARFYALHLTQTLFGNWTLVREWGRIGSLERVAVDWFATFEEAYRAMDKKAQEKLRKEYRTRAYFTASRRHTSQQ